MTKPRTLKPEQLIFQIVAHPPRQPRPPVPKAAKAEKEAPARPKLRITEETVARARQRTRRPVQDHAVAFSPARPPPGVMPAKKLKIAMDEAGSNPAISWAVGGLGNVAFNQGYTFLGYPYLSELAQVAEYRLISEVISTEATRKWIKIKSDADEKAKEADPDAAETKADRIRELEDEFKRLGVREAFEKISLDDGFFGRAHLFLDTGDEGKELAAPIGDGGDFTWKKFRKKGFLRALKTVEPVWTYPLSYNAQNPLADDWYRPEVWYVMSQAVHVSRILPFISKPVPDLLKPAFSFGGLSLSQMAKPYVDNWLETRQSVNDIIKAFSVMVLKTDLQTLLQDSGDGLFNRADLFNNLRDNRGLLMLNKDTEDFANVSAPLGSLDKLQAQAQEHMASVSRIPLVKLMGISPSGLNASSEGELETFDDTIHAYQEKFFGHHLLTVFKLAQLNIWGKVDEDLSFDFVPLAEMSEKEIADLQKARSDTHKNYVDMGAIDPGEVRSSEKNAEYSLYPNINPEDVPEPVLESEHIRETDDVGGGKEGSE